MHGYQKIMNVSGVNSSSPERWFCFPSTVCPEQFDSLHWLLHCLPVQLSFVSCNDHSTSLNNDGNLHICYWSRVTQHTVTLAAHPCHISCQRTKNSPVELWVACWSSNYLVVVKKNKKIVLPLTSHCSPGGVEVSFLCGFSLICLKCLLFYNPFFMFPFLQ